MDRNVVLLCSPDREEWEKLPTVVKHCQDFGANTVRIYPYPILGAFCSFGNRSIQAEAQEKLFAKAIDLREVELVSVLKKRIVDNSFPAERLEDFEKTYSLNQKEIAHDALVESSIGFLPWRDVDDADALHDGPLATRDFINPANTTLIYGASDVGKSWLVMALCMALASGTEIYGLAASEPAKVFCNYSDWDELRRKSSRGYRLPGRSVSPYTQESHASSLFADRT